MKFRIIAEDGRVSVDLYEQQRKSLLAAAAILRALQPYPVFTDQEIPDAAIGKIEELAGVQPQADKPLEGKPVE